MEHNKTIFDYIGQLFATYGIIVGIFIVFSILIGDGASEYSTLFSLGSNGLTIKTLLQLFLLTIIITLSQLVFLTDKWVTNMKLAIRNILFFSVICVAMVIFANVFEWFPTGDVRAWIGFLLSFGVCIGISITVSRLEENIENKKMEQALKRLQDTNKDRTKK